MLCIYGQLCYIFTVIYSCSIVAFYMYDFYTIILYGIMLNLCQSWLLKLDIACHCSLFGSFGKYRNRTESTDTEFPWYRVSAGTDRYRLTEEPNLYGYRRTEPIGSVLPNAQGELRSRMPPHRKTAARTPPFLLRDSTELPTACCCSAVPPHRSRAAAPPPHRRATACHRASSKP